MVHRLFAVVLFVCAALVAAPSFAQELNGEWSPTAGIMAGQKVPDNWLGTMKLSFNQSSFSALSGNLTSKGSVDGGGFGAMKPLVFTITDGADKGNKIFAIYKLENGTLTITYSRDGTQPSGFDSTAGNKYLKLVYTTGGGTQSTVAAGKKAGTADKSAVSTGAGKKGSGGQAAFE